MLNGDVVDPLDGLILLVETVETFVETEVCNSAVAEELCTDEDIDVDDEGDEGPGDTSGVVSEVEDPDVSVVEAGALGVVLGANVAEISAQIHCEWITF